MKEKIYSKCFLLHTTHGIQSADILRLLIDFEMLSRAAQNAFAGRMRPTGRMLCRSDLSQSHQFKISLFLINCDGEFSALHGSVQFVKISTCRSKWCLHTRSLLPLVVFKNEHEGSQPLILHGYICKACFVSERQFTVIKKQ